MTVVAIDFGTSNTVVSIIDPDTKKPITLRFEGISRFFYSSYGATAEDLVYVVPSLVFVGSDRLLFGEEARVHSRQKERFFQAFKRDLAADYQPLPRQIDGKSYSCQIISELFLKHLWQQLEQMPNLSIKPRTVIFTVPVGAFERYLDWFRDLAENLGIPDVRIVDESTAAALGYSIKRPGSLVLVVDFGGGTLDLSLVRTAAGKGGQKVFKAEVLAKSDAYVGGIDIDTWIVEDYLQKIGSSRAEIGEVGWQNLLEVAERLKINLSHVESAKESWFDDENFIAHELELNRQQLEDILESRQLLEQMRQCLDEVLAIAYSKGISKNDIELVTLVGGSCLIPAVQQLIISYFGKSKVKLELPFEAVAHGALVLNSIMEVEDYLRHSYALRLWEPYTKSFSYFTIFEKGTKYPCQRGEPLILQVANEGQKEIRLDIGEVAEISQAEVTYDAQGKIISRLHKQSEYRSLETHRQEVCVAHLNPPGRTNIDRIAVWFEVNEQRILLATVKDLLTGKILVEKGAIAKLQ